MRHRGCVAISGLVRGLVLLVLSVLVWLFASGVAVASPSGWTIQESGTRSLPNGFLSSISCVRVGVCTAVGSYTAHHVPAPPHSAWLQQALVERSKGARWKVQQTLSRTGVMSTSLFGVSCSTVRDCSAVGGGAYVSPNLGFLAYTGRLWAERWSGLSWGAQPAVSPSSQGGLTGVSCASPAVCMAVGYVGFAQQALAESSNGSSWSLQPLPSLPSSPSLEGSPDESFLNGVSCTSTSACTAVGWRNGFGGAALAERWDGTDWTVQPSPALGADPLSAVSCSSGTACTAVGMLFGPSGNHRAMAQRWTGRNWMLESVPNPARQGGDSFLSGISCQTTNSCTAVGATGDLAPGGRPLVAFAASWNGSRWSIKRLPLPRRARTSVLNSVSCTAPNNCTAVGAWSPSSSEGAWFSSGAYYFTKTRVLIEHWTHVL